MAAGLSGVGQGLFRLLSFLASVNYNKNCCRHRGRSWPTGEVPVKDEDIAQPRFDVLYRARESQPSSEKARTEEAVDTRLQKFHNTLKGELRAGDRK